MSALAFCGFASLRAVFDAGSGICGRYFMSQIIACQPTTYLALMKVALISVVLTLLSTRSLHGAAGGGDDYNQDNICAAQ